MSYSSVVLADSPSAYWRLGEASGVNAADATGNGKTGTYENAPTLGVTGLLTGDSDTAVTLNGTNQDVLVPTDIASLATSTSALSIEGWIKTSSAAASSIFGARKNGNANPVLRLTIAATTGVLGFQVRDNAGVGLTTGTSDVSVNDNVRHYVVATRDTSKVWRLYVDGVLALQQADTMTSALNGLDFSYLGRERTLAQFYTGTLDEFATYLGVTLTQTQISAHYTAGSQEATTGDTSEFYPGVILTDTPSYYWRLGETSGIRAADSSGNANHGARRNGAPAGSAGIIPDSVDAAVLLDGTNDRIDIPPWSPVVSATDPWSVEAWVKTSSATAQTIFGGRNIASNNAVLDVSILATFGHVSVTLRTESSSGVPATITGSAVVNDGHAHHVVVTRDASKNVRIYVDGALDAGPTADGITAITNLNKASGGAERVNLTFLNGTLDELALYPTALSAARVTAHYNAAFQASLPFIPSATAVYGPTLPVSVPFIASVTAVYTPVLQSPLVAPFIASVTSVYTPTLVAQIAVPFVSSNTVVYTPTLVNAGISAPFISSVTVVYTPVVTSVEVDPDFIDTVTVVYTPNLMATFTGGGVSQVALEVAAALTDGDAFVSQVTLEIVVPQYKDLHVWQRS